MIEKQVVINNLLVNYYLSGEGAAKTVVFLHGWRAEGRIWQPVTHSLANLNYQIYALDLPGFGKSQLPKKPFTVGDYASIVENFIRKMDIREQVILVGHSFGGRAAIKLAATRSNPINKLVLVDSAGIRVEPKFKTLKNSMAKILKPLFAARAMKPLKKKIYQVMGAEDYVATPELKETFLNVINEDLTPLLMQINVPTLILWGERDKEVPVELGQKMHGLIPRSKFMILPGAGHFSFLDKPREFIRVLTNFLNEPV